jgi:hypothetical protein
MTIPAPEAGLVVHYAYLWHRERQAGTEEGRKDRPVLVLLVERSADGTTGVVVLPITHSAPADPASAVEIPPPVKHHLGLDVARSWIVVAEGNELVWPGYDLRTIPHTERYDYGFLPPRLFKQTLDAFANWSKTHGRVLTPRE